LNAGRRRGTLAADKGGAVMEQRQREGGGARAGDARLIEQAKRELQRMIDINPDVMMLVDGEATVLRANRALLEMLSLSDFSSVVGRKAGELLRPEDAGLPGRLLRDEAGTRDGETAASMSDGQRHMLRMTATGSGSGTWVLTVRDVTAEKEEAARLEKSHKREAVQALAGALMHHANQALTVIMVTANLQEVELEKGNVQVEKLKRGLQNIMTNAARVSELLRRAEHPSDYVTESYLDGLDILDLERSGAPREGEQGGKGR
jgi:hypothetical protein